MKQAFRAIICVILILTFILSIRPDGAEAAESGTEGNFSYTFDGREFTVSVIDADGDTVFSGYRIPETYRSRIVRLVLRSGVTGVNNCSSGLVSGLNFPALKEVVLPDTVSRIGYQAFAGNKALETVNVPGSAVDFYGSAFEDCTSLKKVTLKTGLQTIPARSFSGCTSLENIYIPATVTTIYDDAFKDCTGLTKITFGGAPPVLSNEPFNGVTAQVYTNNTWSEEDMKDYGGDLTWMFPYPSFTKQPDHATVLAKKTVTFSVTGHSVNKDLSYRWQWRTDSSSTWQNLAAGSNYSGETTNKLTITPYANYDGFMFRCILTDRNGKITASRGVYLRVVSTPNISKYVNEGTDGGIAIWFVYDSSKDGVRYNIEIMLNNGEFIPYGSNYGTVEPYRDLNTKEMGKTYTYRVNCERNGVTSDYTKPVAVIRNPFTDVKTSDGYFDKLAWAYNKGIVKGKTNTTFEPNAICTRGQFAIMIWRMAGMPNTKLTRSPFSDVAYSTSSDQVKAILWAYENKIIDGYKDGTFRPNNKCTRAQIVLMLWKRAGKPKVTGVSNPFSDVSKSLGENQVKAILWAVRDGITKGYSDGTFKPNNGCKRSEITTFLYRYYNLVN